MLDIKFYWYFFNYLFRINILIVIIWLFFFFFGFLLLLLLLLWRYFFTISILNLTFCNFIQVSNQLFLESFWKHSQSVADFNFGDFWGKVNILIALQQNHSDLIFSSLMTRQQSLTVYLLICILVDLIEIFYLILNLRTLGKSRICTRIELVKYQTTIFVKTESHFNFFPLLFQIYKFFVMALLKIKVQFTCVSLTKIILGQYLHLLYWISSICQAF